MDAGATEYGGVAEGYMDTVQWMYYAHLANSEKPRIVCEIGFNAGHSAAVWLMANRNISLLSFDMCSHPYTRPNFDMLVGSAVGKSRATLICGDSRETLPAYIARQANPPEVLCDIVHVDGGHEGDVPEMDLRHMRRLSHNHTVLLMDDLACDAPSCKAPKEAWAQLIADGWLAEDACVQLSKRRGFCQGRYLDVPTPPDQ